jgi:hypothetical protein
MYAVSSSSFKEWHDPCIHNQVSKVFNSSFKEWHDSSIYNQVGKVFDSYNNHHNSSHKLIRLQKRPTSWIIVRNPHCHENDNRLYCPLHPAPCFYATHPNPSPIPVPWHHIHNHHLNTGLLNSHLSNSFPDQYSIWSLSRLVLVCPRSRETLDTTRTFRGSKSQRIPVPK